MTTSTLTSWALSIWNTLKEEGFDPLPVFKQAGADPGKLGDGQARYELHTMYQLWELAVKTTRNDDFGVNVGANWGPTTFHALGFAWLASNSLLDGLKRVTRYARLVNNSLIAHLDPAGANYRLTINTTTRIELRHPAGIDGGAAAIIAMCRKLVGNDFKPVELLLTREYRAPGRLEAFAGCEMQYNQSENAVLFDAVQAEKELYTGNAALAQTNEHVAAEYLKRIARDDVVGSVRSTLTKLLPTGEINEEIVSQSLNMNLRTLQRKLKDEGTSFRDILNTTREEIALDYIRNSNLSLTEIGYLLGFADQANFTRAFRRWTEMSPSAYRKNLQSKKVANL